MKFKTFHSALTILLISVLCACGGPTQGPTAWFDQPLEGGQFPMAAIVLQAHASDADGVAAIQFFHDETLLGEVSTGAQRLGDASLEWTPLEAGSYTLLARAADSHGNYGPAAVVHITVGGLASSAVTLAPAPVTGQCASSALTAPMLLFPENGDTVAPDPVLTWTYLDDSCHPSSYIIDISSVSSFSDSGWGFGTNSYTETSRTWPLPVGQCYYWRVKAYVPDVNGPASTAWQFCIEAEDGPTFTLDKNANCREGPGTAYDSDDTLYAGQRITIEGRNANDTWLWVSKPSGSGHCWVSIITGHVAGDLAEVQIASAELPSQPLPPQPLPPEQPVPQQPQDTTPPAISNVSISPGMIQKMGCGSPDQFTITATVTDASGIGNVIYEIRGPGPADGGDGYLLPVGGDSYQATVGPVAGSTGSWSVNLTTHDMASNYGYAGPWTIQIMCIQ